MIIDELSEAAQIRGGFRPRWSQTTTTTTNLDDEPPDVSISSESLGARFSAYLLVDVKMQPPRGAVSQDFVKFLLLQTSPQKVAALGAFHEATYWAYNSVTSETLRAFLRPPAALDYRDEVLDWDVAIKVAPPRPSGRVPVTLTYAGRGAPSPVTDPWD